MSLEEMDTFPGADDSDGLLVDPNMIPTVATEVVMSGDGIERFEEFSENPENPEDVETYQYEYAYEEDPEHPPIHHHGLMEEEVVVADGEYQDDWKDAEHKKMNLYEVLDAKVYMPHKTASKRSRIDEFTDVYQPDGPDGPGDYNYGGQEVEEYREYAVYAPTPTKPNSHSNAADRSCPGCGMTLRRSVYYHHARMIREKGACNLFTPQRFPCTQCDARIGTLEKLCQHMEQIHHAPTEIKTVIFTNEEDFKTFRIDLEGKGGNFRMARGNKKNKKGVVQYFRCNRLQTLAKSQTYRPVDNPNLHDLPSNRKRGRLHQQEVRTNSAKQVIRTENSCTAFYNKAYLENGTIEVRYCEHHLHDDEKLRLPDAVRERVIMLAKKNLPHIVVLMIIKDERLKYCDRESANERRILDMKTQDIRQVLAGNNRAVKIKLKRTENSREMLEKQQQQHEDGEMNPDVMMAPEEEPIIDPTKAWLEARPVMKIDRDLLTATERRYLDLFDSNREEIMARLNEKTRAEQDKKMLFDSFIHRLSSSQEVFKHIQYRQLLPNDGTMLKLRKACQYLTRIEQLLRNPRKEPQQVQRFSSYMRMMEEEYENGQERDQGPGNLEEIDVVGIDDEEYEGQQAVVGHPELHHLHNVVGEEEVVEYQQASEELDELQGEGEYVEEEVIEEVEEVEMDPAGEEGQELAEQQGEGEEEQEQEHMEQEEEEEEDPQMSQEGEEEEPTEPTVTRAGRVVKKKPLFDS